MSLFAALVCAIGAITSAWERDRRWLVFFVVLGVLNLGAFAFDV